MILQLTDDGFKALAMRQGASLNEATKKWEQLVLSKQIRHGNDPVMRWCVNNAVVHPDRLDNIWPDKAKSTTRIDPLVAGICALARIMVNPSHTSRYESGGIRYL